MKFSKKLKRWMGLAAVYIMIIPPALFFLFRHRLEFSPENKDVGKIIVYGDIRSSYAVHNKVAKLIAEEKPGMVIFTGDIASNSHNFLHFLIQTIIEHKIWKNAEYYPTRGNHESDLFFYKLFFELPEGKTSYSFDRNGMHFIALDIITNEPVDRDLLEWLEKDLEKNKGKPVSVSMHLPLFTSGKYEPYHAPNLLELFKKYDVLFVFCAHVHCYERSFYEGTHYITTAGGGAPLYPVTRDNPYKVIREQKHHYCILTKTETGIYTLTAKDTDGNIIDTVTASVAEKRKASSRPQ